jgi:hypothetical protein
MIMNMKELRTSVVSSSMCQIPLHMSSRVLRADHLSIFKDLDTSA